MTSKTATHAVWWARTSSHAALTSCLSTWSSTLTSHATRRPTSIVSVVQAALVAMVLQSTSWRMTTSTTCFRLRVNWTRLYRHYPRTLTRICIASDSELIYSIKLSKWTLSVFHDGRLRVLQWWQHVCLQSRLFTWSKRFFIAILLFLRWLICVWQMILCWVDCWRVLCCICLRCWVNLFIIFKLMISFRWLCRWWKFIEIRSFALL